MISDITFILLGVQQTLLFAGSSLIGGLCIGIALSLMQNQEGILKLTSKAYVSVFRGTPILLQLSLVYFALPGLTGIKLSAFMAGFITFSCNSGAYLAEVLRSGFQSIPSCQIEGAKVLGISKFHIFKDILLPQALRNSFPSIMNELITLLKETALISVIGVNDIMRQSQLLAAQQYDYIGPLVIAGLCYYLLVLALSGLSKTVEWRLNRAYT